MKRKREKGSKVEYLLFLTKNAFFRNSIIMMMFFFSPIIYILIIVGADERE